MKEVMHLSNADYSGWQYWVYYHDEIVEKYPKSFGSVLAQIAISNPSLVAKPHVLFRSAHETICRRKNSVRGIKSSDIDCSLFGNISFDDGIAYQDRVEPIDAMLDSKDIDRSRQLIDRWIDFLFSCWREGFGERSYNLLHNYGLSGEDFVLIDFGELTFDKKLVMQDVREKRWLGQWWFTQVRPELQELVRSSFNTRVTPEKVAENWNKQGNVVSNSADWSMRMDEL